MKQLQNKQILSTVLLSCTLLFTTSAFAEEASLEQSLAAVVQAQEKKAVRDLSAELSNSIKAELERFSMRYTTVTTQAVAAVSKPVNLHQYKQKISQY